MELFLVTIYCFSYKMIVSPFLSAEVAINFVPYIVLTILRIILFVGFIFILRKEKNFYYKVFIYILIDIILVLITSYYTVGYRFIFGLNDITDTEGNLSYFLFLYLIYYIFVFLLPFLLLKKNYSSNK